MLACFQLVLVFVVCPFYKSGTYSSRPTSSTYRVRFASTADVPSHRRQGYGIYHWTQKEWTPGECRCCVSCGIVSCCRVARLALAGIDCTAYRVYVRGFRQRLFLTYFSPCLVHGGQRATRGVREQRQSSATTCDLRCNVYHVTGVHLVQHFDGINRNRKPGTSEMLAGRRRLSFFFPRVGFSSAGISNFRVFVKNNKTKQFLGKMTTKLSVLNAVP